ncbi:MAG: hypothetical protein QJR03_15090 [Sphaerobacter sp.]|nr:hypothetical protein [Sphaerobacter sp.]
MGDGSLDLALLVHEGARAAEQARERMAYAPEEDWRWLDWMAARERLSALLRVAREGATEGGEDRCPSRR